jgi:hypothetical protein
MLQLRAHPSYSREAQYENTFAEWVFGKKVGKDRLPVIDYYLSTREREGKRNELLLNDVSCKTRGLIGRIAGCQAGITIQWSHVGEK